ncbi:hypothetical protein FACS1894159_04390 [Bacteroidia bacterium]|nr:hypothetical protein FACS1894159_04390 [Bacteroidia bacterium]
MIRVSFIIATFNRAGGIVATLTSLLEQSLGREMFEVVVADNNSTDDTAARVRDFAAGNPSMQIVYTFEPRQGLSYARNAAIAHSRGELLVVVDDDELIDPALAQVYLDFFDARPEAAAAGGVVVPRYGVERPRWFSPWIEELISGSFYLGDKVRRFGRGRYPRGGNFCIRRSMIDRYGLFNTDLGRQGGKALSGEEKDLLGRLTEGGERLYYLPGAIIEHLIPDAKVTDEYFRRVSRMLGVSERIRTLSLSRWRYLGRLALEVVKWGGAAVYALGYLLRATPVRGLYLLRMRWQVTCGLLQKP